MQLANGFRREVYNVHQLSPYASGSIANPLTRRLDEGRGSRKLPRSDLQCAERNQRLDNVGRAIAADAPAGSVAAISSRDSPPKNYSSTVTSIALSPCGRALPVSQQDYVHLIDPTSGDVLRVLSAHATPRPSAPHSYSSVDFLRFSPDAIRLITASRRGTLAVSATGLTPQVVAKESSQKTTNHAGPELAVVGR